MSQDSTENSSTSKAWHTPGPFYIQGSSLIRKFAEDGHIAVGPAPAMPYGDELVSLLNKGTHFDELREACIGLLSGDLPPHEAEAIAEAAIAKAEGTDD